MAFAAPVSSAEVTSDDVFVGVVSGAAVLSEILTAGAVVDSTIVATAACSAGAAS